MKGFVEALCHTSCRHALVLISFHSNIFSQAQLGSTPLFLYVLIYTANITHWVNGWNIFLLQQSVLTLTPHWRLIYSSIPPVSSKSLMVNYGGAYEKSPPYRPNRDKSSRTSPFAWKKNDRLVSESLLEEERQPSVINVNDERRGKKFACSRGIDFCDELVSALSTVKLLIYECANFQVFGLAV